MRKKVKPELKSRIDLLQERIMIVLESNAALCMDVQEERKLLADILIQSLIGDEGLEEFGFKPKA